jgi:hypothetical protein
MKIPPTTSVQGKVGFDFSLENVAKFMHIDGEPVPQNFQALNDSFAEHGEGNQGLTT